MEFTYRAYKDMLSVLKSNGYEFADYHNWEEFEHCVILRHDIDQDISKAVKLAAIEQDGGVKSTYFVLVTSDFYNVFSMESCDGLKRIMDTGHEIGLHFDEVCYPESKGKLKQISELIQYEADLLGNAIGKKIKVVSMHRPSKRLLDSNLEIPGMINSYSQTFFRDFKYLSDSRKHWREPVDKIIESKEYKRIHLLTHAFWYNDEECDLHDSVKHFINDGNRFRYDRLLDNITDLESIMNRKELI